MATPMENITISHSSFMSTDHDPFYKLLNLRKQTQNSGEDSVDVAEDSQKTRRVNPQRLAARLGPEIVAEMEALIYPGAKMPTFEVRRVIQERYAVDRRHIYDYFHSRGLRVAKEDKHTNLTRGRLSKALAQHSPSETLPSTLDLSSKASIDKLADQPSDKGGFDTGFVTGSPMTLDTVPFEDLPVILSENLNQSSSRNAKRVASERISGLKRKRRRHALSAEMSKLAIKEHLPSKAHCHINSSILSQSSALDLISLPRTPSPCPEFTMSEDIPDYYGDESAALTTRPPSDSIMEFWDVISDLNHHTPLDDYKRDTLANIGEHRPLTQRERNELYNLINDNIEAAHGIEECVGSYYAYMKEQAQHYFDRISYKTNRQTKIYHAIQGDICISNQTNGDIEVDFQQWLSVHEEPDQLRLPETSDVYPARHFNTQHQSKLNISDTPQHSYTRLDIKERAADRLRDTIDSTSFEAVGHTAARRVRTEASFTRLQHKHNFELPSRSPITPPKDEPADGKPDQAIGTVPVSVPHLGHPIDFAHPTSHVSTPRVRIEASFISSAIADPNPAHSRVTSCLASVPNDVQTSYLEERDIFKAGRQAQRPGRLRTASAGGGI